MALTTTSACRRCRLDALQPGRLGPWQGSPTPGAMGRPFGQPLGIFHWHLPRARHPPTGRAMEVYTTQPGIQFYTGNNLDGSLKGKGAIAYPKHSAFCLETQNWPDAINKVNRPPTPGSCLGPAAGDHTTPPPPPCLWGIKCMNRVCLVRVRSVDTRIEAGTGHNVLWC